MDFGEAIRLLKDGKRVTRAGWNGPNMWVYYVPGGVFSTATPAARAAFGDAAPYRPYLAMKTAQGDVAFWTASQSDVLAEDWFEV